ncbi:MAG: hypothetical protein JXA68_10330, partial [Ignavibacteriales bacterium]|nr:hypothetical protein [Ignavibacteriales bacterium]
KYNKKIKRFIPNQFLDVGRKSFDDKYTNIINIAMFVAGMTDTIAVDTYRCIKGISLPTY